MIVKNEPYLIEYNVRMGDPECQTILPKLKNDVVDVFLACCEKKLDRIEFCLLYTSPSPRDISGSRMPSSA